MDNHSGSSLSPRSVTKGFISKCSGRYRNIGSANVIMRPKVELILASASSRRSELLGLLAIPYTHFVTNIDETPGTNEQPDKYVQRLARAKAEFAWRATTNQFPVLAADTVIALDGVILGKPKDRQDAKYCLKMLSGRKHKVQTGLCLWTNAGIYESRSVTCVKFRVITPHELEAYSLTKEPYDKAGAYAMQGLAATFVEYFLGSYTNVIGLPLNEVKALLKQANLI